MDPIKCPECNRSGFRDNRGLSSHRRATHGYISQSKTARYQRRKQKPQHAVSENTAHEHVTEIVEAIDIAYAVGRTEEFIRHLAEKAGRPDREFTSRVVQHLQRQAGGGKLGHQHHLPLLRREAA